MGHIYRALSLAHHITNHDILFVCDEKDELVVESIASKDYKVIPSKNKLNTILALQPDLVINDILNTDINYIDTLRKNNIKVVNFEDLGEGVKRANIVFNELYDIPVIDGDNILWGYEWYFLRDEFDEAKQNNFENVKNVLITFGGTDQHNLTLKTLKIVKDYPFKITIVCGGGYLYKTELQEYVNKNNLDVEIIYKTGVISKKMENIQIAITSNGRTVYELAHMHIPSIIVSQHKREETHHFSKLENGFIRLGNFEEIDDFDKKFRYYFDKILDNDYRYLLYLNTKKFNFLSNKQKVIRKIVKLIEK
jgi:spore coat polysaccharide biosynthesis predicted glycosyltransferase SpsG